MYLGRYRQALAAAAGGRRLLTRTHDHASLARLANNEGNIFHRLDQPERAMARYRAARRWLRRATDSRGAAMVEGNIANCLSSLGRCSEARRLYVAAQDVHRASGFDLDALNAGYNLAYVDFLEHRYESALEGLEHVRENARERNYPSLAALAALDRSEIFLRMGAHGSALTEARRASRECGALELSYERAKAETFAALAEHRLGQHDAAISGLERSLAVFDAEGNDVWSGEALVGLATIWRRDGNARAAAALLASARRRFARVGDREREACCLALLVGAHLESGDLRSARAHLSALERRARRRSSPRLRHLALGAEASVAAVRGDMERARAKLRQAAAHAERLAARVLDEQWRSSFWGEWGWPHLELAVLELGEGRVAEALEALERGRGRAVAGVFGRRRGQQELPKGVREWAASRQAAERKSPTRSGAGVAGRLRESERIAMGPDVGRALRSLPARTVRPDALRRGLASRQVLVDYFLHGGALGAIAVTRHGLQGHAKLLGERDLGRLVHSLLFDLRGAAFMPAGERKFTPGIDEQLTELAALVLWPILDRLPGLTEPDSIAIVPVGPLARLPWAALPLPDGRVLCEAMELVVIPGLRLAGTGARVGVSRDHAAPLIVASDPDELPNVERETRALAERFPGARLLAGRDATAGRFLEAAPGAPWIHFAGHGHFRADAPHESALRFADRWLPAEELAELRLSASWVGLSACQTARALVRPGEEWFGLARSFLLSGARAVLASQWDIEDEAAARLMVDTYGRMATGESLPLALSRAQAASHREGTHPLEWAGFVILGGLGSGPHGSHGEHS